VEVEDKADVWGPRISKWRREATGVNRSFRMFGRSSQAHCHTGVFTWRAMSAKIVKKRKRFTIYDDNYIRACIKLANGGVPSVRMAKC
jgi:hypothetical protein